MQDICPFFYIESKVPKTGTFNHDFYDFLTRFSFFTFETGFLRPFRSVIPAAKVRTFFLSVTDYYRILRLLTAFYRILRIPTDPYRLGGRLPSLERQTNGKRTDTTILSFDNSPRPLAKPQVISVQ